MPLTRNAMNVASKITLVVATALAVGWACSGVLHSRPQQFNVVPWTSPATTLPKAFVDAVAFLHDHGLGDPRGGQYRAVAIQTRSGRGSKAEVTNVHGWVLPSKEGRPQQVVALNGLTYEVLSVGDLVDPQRDVETTLADRTPIPVGLDGPSSMNLTPETATALLLISGDASSAEKLFARRSFANDREEFMRLAGSFLPGWWHQAVTAHMVGDDQTAEREASRIAANYDALNAEGERVLGAQRVKETRRTSTDFTNWEPFQYLKPAKVLAEDSQRRLETKAKTTTMEQISALPQAQRIAALIDRLDEVSARQWSQPGGVDLVEDPIAKALIHDGNPAVEQLFTVLEEDDRLTRSVSFGRDFFPERHLLTVKDAAFGIFCAIAQFSEFPDHSVACLRTFWKNCQNLKPVERWFQVLKDDNASHRQWNEAARFLFEPDNVTHTNQWVVTSKPDGKVHLLKAEMLRGIRNPSLSDLLARRALQLPIADPPHSSNVWFGVADGFRMASNLADWDPKAAVEPLRGLCKTAFDISAERYNSGSLDIMGDALGKGIDERVRIGDTHALEEYAAWLLKVPGPFEEPVLEPLMHYGDKPALQGVARHMFLDSKSPNCLLSLAHAEPGSPRPEQFVTEQTLVVPALREAATQVLDDQQVTGSSWVTGNGKMSQIQSKSGERGEGLSEAERGDPRFPVDDNHVPFRVCDEMARVISHFKGCPEFEPYWLVIHKDEAIEKIKQYLKTHRFSSAAKPVSN